MKKFFTTRRVFLVAIVAIVLVGIWFVFFNTEDLTNEIEIQAVSKGEVIEIVSETGFAQASHEVTLAFERGGKVASLPVQAGDLVAEGAPLVILDSSERQAELSAAQARLQAEQVRLSELISGADSISLGVTGSAVNSAETTFKNAQINLEEVIAQQNQLVSNAEASLRSIGIEAYLTSQDRESTNFTYTAPTISGTYDSDEEGSYYIDLYNSGSQSGSSFRVTGLESGNGSVSIANPTPVGIRGLYILFPEDFAKKTEWEIPIPNTRSSSYLTYLNAYNAAVDARDIAIKTAENAVKSAEAALEQTNQQYTQVSSSARDERVAAQQALVNQMQAAVESAEIALEKTTLRAPFSGVVTDILVEAGEIISPSVPAASLISNDNYEIVVNISESDIQEVTIDDTATILFDAYDGIEFEAKVVRIAPSAKVVESVRVFEVILRFTTDDERIRSGLSADIDILAAERPDVIAVPTRSIVEREDGKYVRRWNGDSISYLPVQTGLRGSDGTTEIVGGLSEGTEIVTFAREEVVEKLKVTE